MLKILSRFNKGSVVTFRIAASPESRAHQPLPWRYEMRSSRCAVFIKHILFYGWFQCSSPQHEYPPPFKVLLLNLRFCIWICSCFPFVLFGLPANVNFDKVDSPSRPDPNVKTSSSSASSALGGAFTCAFPVSKHLDWHNFVCIPSPKFLQLQWSRVLDFEGDPL